MYLFNFFWLQILTLYDSINVIDVNKVVEYVQSLQKEDGSFAGDIWGNVILILPNIPVLNVLVFIVISSAAYF